jgi:hypothetical protein
VRRVGPARRAPEGPPVRSLSRELRTACCRGQDPVPPLHSSRRRKEDRAAAIKGWHHEHPRGSAAHGPSCPPVPLQAATASSGFRLAAHQPSSPPPPRASATASQATHSRAPAVNSPKQEARRPVPVAAAARHRRQRLHPDPTLKPMLGEPLAILLPFPSLFRYQSTGIWAGAAGNHAQGPNCRRPALYREFYANQGPICESLNLSEGLVTKLYLQWYTPFAETCKMRRKS